MARTKILIADDHAVVRRGLRFILREALATDLRFAEAGNVRELLELFDQETWSLVILDVCMPGRDGLDALKELKARRPEVPVLMLSVYPEESFGVRALRARASGYVVKASAAEEFVDAVKTVLAGDKYISPNLARHLAALMEEDAKIPLHQNLSDREYEVMLMIAQGKTVSEIASELLLSVKTVSTHHEHVLRKLQLQNNAQIMRYAFENRLVT